MKTVIKLLTGILILAVIALGAVWFHIGTLIKKGVETAGPQVTKVDVKLSGAGISLLGGRGLLSGLFVGNPQGYKTDSAVKVKKISVAVDPNSVFSDKVVVKEVVVKAPEITIEGSLSDNNLTQIQRNIAIFTGSDGKKPADKSAASKPSAPGKKFVVNELLISGARVHVALKMFGGQNITVPLPDIQLHNLGQDKDGISSGELMQIVTSKLLASIGPAVTSGLHGLDPGALAKGITKEPAKALEQAGGLAGLLKRN